MRLIGLDLRTFVVLGIVLLIPGCTLSQHSSTPAAGEFDAEAAREAILTAHQQLADAYEAGDVEKFAALLAPDEDLLIFHPRQVDRFDGITEVRDSLGKMFARVKGATWTDFHTQVTVTEQVGWLTSHVLLEAPGLGESFVGRGTEVWVQQGERWLLAHAHWSTNPEGT